jgi:amino acid transporter
MPRDPASPPPELPRLAPVLGPVSAFAIVVGLVIGSGIFIKPAAIARDTQGNVALILGLWAICGVVNLCGALAMAELSAMMPHAGGTYVFLRESYGRLWSFLWVWGEFWVIRSGSIAALGAAGTISLRQLLASSGWQLSPFEQKLLERSVAIGSIAILTVINIAGTRYGGAVQNVTTVIKAGFVAFLALLPFLALGREHVPLDLRLPGSYGLALWAGVGSAIASIMWAYDGWGSLTVVAEEIKRPQRNVPLALGGGVLFITVLYVAVNLAYHLTLPSAAIGAAPVPAVSVTERLLPRIGTPLVLSMLMISVLGALNANVLAGPRALFALGRDYERLARLRTIDPRRGTPAWAIATLSIWSIILVLLADLSPVPNKTLFDVLTDYCIFGGSVFYYSAVIGVFVLRVKRPKAERPYRTWGYPVVPAIFVAFYTYLLASMVGAPETRWQSLSGLGLIALGVPAFFALTGGPEIGPGRRA